MTALIKKDMLLLFKQFKLILVVIFLFSIFLGDFYTSFVIVYAAMLPLTAIGLDEASKWDSMAAMMPVRSLDLVFSKYVLGYALVLATSLIALIASIVRTRILDPTLLFNETLYQIFFSVCIATIVMAVVLPLIFKLGVEKGRLAFLALFALVFVFSFLFSGNFIRAIAYVFDGQITSLPVIIGVVLGLCMIVNAVSVFLSNEFYKRKQF